MSNHKYFDESWSFGPWMPQVEQGPGYIAPQVYGDGYYGLTTREGQPRFVARRQVWGDGGPVYSVRAPLGLGAFGTTGTAQPGLSTFSCATRLTANEWIRSVQTMLNGMGHNTGAVDGKLGPNTARGIQSYAAANGAEAARGLVGAAVYDCALRVLGTTGTGAGAGSGTQPRPGGLTPAGGATSFWPWLTSPAVILIGLPVAIGVGLLAYELYKSTRTKTRRRKLTKRAEKTAEETPWSLTRQEA